MYSLILFYSVFLMNFYINRVVHSTSKNKLSGAGFNLTNTEYHSRSREVALNCVQKQFILLGKEFMSLNKIRFICLCRAQN